MSSIVALIIAYAAVFADATPVRDFEIQVRMQGTKLVHLSSVPGFDPDYRYVFPKESPFSMSDTSVGVVYEKDSGGQFFKYPLPAHQSPQTMGPSSSRGYSTNPSDPVCIRLPAFHFPAAVKMIAKNADVTLPEFSLTWRIMSANASLPSDQVVRIYKKVGAKADSWPTWRKRIDGCRTARYELFQTYEPIVTAVGQQRFGNLFRFLSNPQDLLMQLGWKVSTPNLMTASIEELVFLQKHEIQKNTGPIDPSSQEVFASDDDSDEK